MLLTVVMVGGLLACRSGVESAPPSAGPPRGQVTFPSGRVFSVELALTAQDQARGYMGRRKIAPDEGMLFVYHRPATRQFWMKNCLVPIDMIWLDDEDRVVATEPNAPPCREDPCPAYGPVIPTYSVLEVAGGTVSHEGLEPGDRLLIVTDESLE
ncbi:MAG: DUF192 domain-containing protein [Acidobacteriota bacterium]